MKVVAFDPGGTTGWAIFELDTEAVIIDTSNVLFFRDHVKQGQLGGNEEHHKLLWMFLARERPDVIVGERFDNRGNEFAKLMSREYIGILKLYVAMNPEVVLMWQGADQAFGWATDAKLRRLAILCVPLKQWKDANAALRHLVYHLVFKADRVLQAVRENILITLKELEAE